MITRQIVKKEKNNSFYPVNMNEISEAEKDLGLTFPKELKDFYIQIGYGFFGGSRFNIDRLMDPYSVRDFRLRQNDFEFYPDIDIYDDYEDNKLIFFETNESALLSIELGSKEKSKIYYYNTVIADSLEEFIIKIQENDSYFVNMLE